MTDPHAMPDAALAEAVAVEVFKWKRADAETCSALDDLITDLADIPLWLQPCGDGSWAPTALRPYASDIAAAMEVFAVAGDDDHPIEPTGEPSAGLRCHRDDSGPPRWSAEFMLTDLCRKGRVGTEYSRTMKI